MARDVNVSLIVALMELVDTVEDLTGIKDKTALYGVTRCLLDEFIDYLNDDEAWQALLKEIVVNYQLRKESKNS